VTTKWIFVDESGAEPKQTPPEGGHFALSAVAVDDAEATRSALGSLLSELKPVAQEANVSRVLRRGYFHASKDARMLRRRFLSFVSQLRFHCRTARLPWTSPPALNCYDALVAELFANMGPPGSWSDTMHVVIALRGAQSPATCKGRDYQALFSSIRRYLESRFPSLARGMPSTHTVRHVRFADEPCLQLPDYCGWAIRRWLLNSDDEWLRTLCPKGPGWDYEQGRLILPPDTAGLYISAGEITGVDFYCGP